MAARDKLTIDARRPIVVLTGAGISKESGLDTFRDADGIWSRVRIEDVATPEAFARDPVRVHTFYNQRRRQLLSPTVKPNAAHLALAKLEREWPGGVAVVTQNIDHLHEAAGSREVIHMHGELRKARCVAGGCVVAWDGDLGLDDHCPACGAVGALRPHVVWFGEMPLALERIYDRLRDCGLFIAIGTSGNVYPAAGFVGEVRARRDRGPGDRALTVELNLEDSETSSLFDHAIRGPAGRIVPAYVTALLGTVGR